MRVWLIDLCFAFFMLSAGSTAGWWLRGRKLYGQSRRTSLRQRHGTEDALQGLHEITDSVKSCVEEHTACIQVIEANLNGASVDQPSVVDGATSALRQANELAQHRFNSIQRHLGQKSESIRRCLDYDKQLLLTTISLDRQKRVYQSVLTSLEMLTNEMGQDVNDHGQRLQQIASQVEDAEQQAVGDVTAAVAETLDANGEMQTRIERAEATIREQAENVSMEAVLAHADIMTALPNRRAFEVELHRQYVRFRDQGPSFTIVLLDLDGFGQVNQICGHEGGDTILHQVAALLKQTARGPDLVARQSGESFAMLLSSTTLAKALPVAERHRQVLEAVQFSASGRGLRVTASVGVAQILPEEDLDSLRERAENALYAAKHAGRNATYWHDGHDCYPVNTIHKRDAAAMETPPPPKPKPIETRPAANSEVLDEHRESRPDDGPQFTERQEPAEGQSDVELSSRTAFCSNVRRRIAEWQRGGPVLSVILVRVDQHAAIVSRFGPESRAFLRGVIGRVLEAATRDMDDRCEYDDQAFAILLPSADQESAARVSRRVHRQVSECKVRMNKADWDLTASVGVVQCSEGDSMMDLLMRAESAMQCAHEQGGDAIYTTDPTQQRPIRLGF